MAVSVDSRVKVALETRTASEKIFTQLFAVGLMNEFHRDRLPA